MNTTFFPTPNNLDTWNHLFDRIILQSDTVPPTAPPPPIGWAITRRIASGYINTPVTVYITADASLTPAIVGAPAGIFLTNIVPGASFNIWQLTMTPQIVGQTQIAISGLSPSPQIITLIGYAQAVVEPDLLFKVGLETASLGNNESVNFTILHATARTITYSTTDLTVSAGTSFQVNDHLTLTQYSIQNNIPSPFADSTTEIVFSDGYNSATVSVTIHDAFVPDSITLASYPDVLITGSEAVITGVFTSNSTPITASAGSLHILNNNAFNLSLPVVLGQNSVTLTSGTYSTEVNFEGVQLDIPMPDIQLIAQSQVTALGGQVYFPIFQNDPTTPTISTSSLTLSSPEPAGNNFWKWYVTGVITADTVVTFSSSVATNTVTTDIDFVPLNTPQMIFNHTDGSVIASALSVTLFTTAIQDVTFTITNGTIESTTYTQSGATRTYLVTVANVTYDSPVILTAHSLSTGLSTSKTWTFIQPPVQLTPSITPISVPRYTVTGNITRAFSVIVSDGTAAGIGIAGNIRVNNAIPTGISITPIEEGYSQVNFNFLFNPTTVNTIVISLVNGSTVLAEYSFDVTITIPTVTNLQATTAQTLLASNSFSIPITFDVDLNGIVAPVSNINTAVGSAINAALSGFTSTASVNHVQRTATVTATGNVLANNFTNITAVTLSYGWVATDWFNNASYFINLPGITSSNINDIVTVTNTTGNDIPIISFYDIGEVVGVTVRASESSFNYNFRVEQNGVLLISHNSFVNRIPVANGVFNGNILTIPDINDILDASVVERRFLTHVEWNLTTSGNIVALSNSFIEVLEDASGYAIQVLTDTGQLFSVLGDSSTLRQEPVHNTGTPIEQRRFFQQHGLMELSSRLFRPVIGRWFNDLTVIRANGTVEVGHFWGNTLTVFTDTPILANEFLTLRSTINVPIMEATAGSQWVSVSEPQAISITFNQLSAALESF